MSGDRPASDLRGLGRRHFRLGWMVLLVFLLLGLFLEAMHGFKVGAYLNVSNETRRLLWTLAHAHGALLALVQIAFAATLFAAASSPFSDSTSKAASLPPRSAQRLELASRALLAGQILLPLGFFLGGAFLYDGDPGLGIFLVPPGALLLLAAVALIATETRALFGADPPSGRASKG